MFPYDELFGFSLSGAFSFMKWLGIAWLVYIICLSIWIILQKRAPVSTLSWILALAFIPYGGFIIYHFFGPQKLKRQQFRRLLSRTALKEHSDYLQLRNHILAASTHSQELMQLANMIRTTTGFPLTTAKSLKLLVDGTETFTAILDAIAHATHHIHLEYYIFDPDRIGTRLRDLLIQKAKEGVKVRLLVDGIGSSRLKNAFIQPLLRAGARFAFFHKPHITQLIKPLVNLRTHRKIVICDGLVGFTGGLNITDQEDERVYEYAYHDTHLQLTGNAVHWLQLIFMEDWLYASGEKEIPDLANYFPIQSSGPYPVQVIPSGPDNEWEIIHRIYLSMIQRARKRIWLTTPYFVPTEATLFALTSAALRGVDVRLLVPRMSDSRLVTSAARSYFDELMRAGVRIWEYHGRMLHSKTIVVDHHYSLIGTANFDSRSFRLNFEVCIAAYGPRLAELLSDQFECDLVCAERVPFNRHIGLLQKMFEATARLFSPLL